MNVRRRGLAKAVIVALAMGIAMFVTYAASLQSFARYEARLYFQLAASSANDKPSLAAERDLLLSDTLLTQVLKDLNLMPVGEAPKFRSFDLGPDYKSQSEKPDQARLNFYRKSLSVRAYPENSVIGVFYQSADSKQAKEIVETLFEKFRDWRGAGQKAGFSPDMVSADRDLSQKRENFLRSQQALLEYVDGNQNAGDRLKARKAELASKIAALRLRYGPKHPVLIEALREQEILAKTVVTQATPDKGKVALLRDKMETDFRNLDTAIRQSVVAEQQKGAGGAPFQLLPLGDVEVKMLPRHARLKAFVAGVAVLVIALLFPFTKRLVRSTVETGPALKEIFGYPVLARIPGLVKESERDLPLPAGATADAIKALRQELKLRSWTTPIKMVTVTSTWPREGRSELVAALGRLSARAGEKVLILDADLREPTLQQAIPLRASRNLVDYLSGQARLEDIVIRTDPSGVHLVYGTAIPNTALDLLSSDKMKNLLVSLREAYDLVLVQAPVSLRGPDARVLGALSDQVLYLVEAAKTRKRDIKEGISSFAESGIKTLSFVLTEK